MTRHDLSFWASAFVWALSSWSVACAGHADAVAFPPRAIDADQERGMPPSRPLPPSAYNLRPSALSPAPPSSVDLAGPYGLGAMRAAGALEQRTLVRLTCRSVEPNGPVRPGSAFVVCE
jgi:hypothetical protein